jgi:hypothetical protein
MTKLLTLALAIACSAGCGSKQPSNGNPNGNPNDNGNGGGSGSPTPDMATAPPNQNPPPPPPTGTTPYDQFVTSRNQAMCKYWARCGVIGASEEQQCETDLQAAFLGYPPAFSIDASITAMHMTFNANSVSACLTAIAQAGCLGNGFRMANQLCKAVLTGTLAAGAPCLSSDECAGTDYCGSSTGELGDGCMGTCKSQLAAGAACDPNNDECGPNLYCDSTKKQCVAGAAVGASCSSTVFCQDALVCVGDVPASGTTPEVPGKCAQLGAAGAACDTDGACQTGLFCNTEAATPVCTARTAAAGGACSAFEACPDGKLCIGLTVDATTGKLTKAGTCGAVLDVGATCDPTPSESGCPFDTICDATSKKCVAASALGAACTPGERSCRDGLYCDSTTSKCTKLVALGQSCVPQPTTMNSEESCHDGTCDATSKLCVVSCM